MCPLAFFAGDNSSDHGQLGADFITIPLTQNSEDYASEISQGLANSRECRAYFCEPDIAYRDGTGWLG